MIQLGGYQIKLRTQRLILKSPVESFAQLLLDYNLKNKEFFQPWSPQQSKEFYSLKEQKALLQKKCDNFQKESEIQFYIFHKSNDNKIIGDICFSNIIKGPFLSCFLGYKIEREETRKGYMQEALIKSIKYVFNTVKLHRIEANIMPHNRPSIQLITKLGFEYEGLSRKYLKINGKWENHLHFVLLNEAVE